MTITEPQPRPASHPPGGGQTPTDHGRTEVLRSVANAIDVLECFALDPELGVSDIARKLGIAKSTAHRLLVTLCARGLAEQNPHTGQYRLGMHLYELGSLAQRRNGLRDAAMPVMRELADQTHQAVHLGIPDGADVVFVERLHAVEGPLGVVAARVPAHCTSSGKALAAFNQEFDSARRSAGFPPRVRNTVRSLADWEVQLRTVRRAGYAAAHSEAVDGAASVAVPIFGPRHVAVASLSIYGPTPVMVPMMSKLVPMLRRGAAQITHVLTAA
jgi:DNA-binding IclR family transcriptional regulator